MVGHARRVAYVVVVIFTVPETGRITARDDPSRQAADPAAAMPPPSVAN